MDDDRSLLCTVWALLGAEDSISGITETGADVGVLIEAVIKGGRVDGYIGMGRLHRVDSLGSTDQTDQSEVPAAMGFQPLNGETGRAARGQHGIDHEDRSIGDVMGHLLVVGNRLHGVFIPVDTQMADPGLGQQGQNAVDHADAGPKNRNQRDRKSESDGLGRFEGGLDRDRFGPEITTDTKGHQPGDLIEQTAELLGWSGRVPEPTQPVLNDRVIKDGQIRMVRMGCGHETSVPALFMVA